MEEKNFLEIYGASDDLIEFDGCIYDEIGCYDSSCKILIPDGTKFEIFYNENGLWEIKNYIKGNLYEAEITPPNIEEDKTGKIIINGTPEYIICKTDKTLYALGDIELNEKEQEMFNQLSELFGDIDEFNERSNLVKAILRQINIVEL